MGEVLKPAPREQPVLAGVGRELLLTEPGQPGLQGRGRPEGAGGFRAAAGLVPILCPPSPRPPETLSPQPQVQESGRPPSLHRAGLGARLQGRPPSCRPTQSMPSAKRSCSPTWLWQLCSFIHSLIHSFISQALVGGPPSSGGCSVCSRSRREQKMLPRPSTGPHGFQGTGVKRWMEETGLIRVVRARLLPRKYRTGSPRVTQLGL